MNGSAGLATWPILTLQAGTVLFHGTACAGDFVIPDGPALRHRIYGIEVLSGGRVEAAGLTATGSVPVTPT